MREHPVALQRTLEFLTPLSGDTASGRGDDNLITHLDGTEDHREAHVVDIDTTSRDFLTNTLFIVGAMNRKAVPTKCSSVCIEDKGVIGFRYRLQADVSIALFT